MAAETDGKASNKPSLLKQLGQLLKTHIELGLLESRFEAEQRARRAAVLAVAAFLGLTAYVFLQVLIVQGLMAAGLSAALACLVLFGLYALTAAVLVLAVGKRQPQAGQPFQGSRDEFQRSREWIRARFS
jgi:hypothetical protein